MKIEMMKIDPIEMAQELSEQILLLVGRSIINQSPSCGIDEFHLGDAVTREIESALFRKIVK